MPKKIAPPADETDESVETTTEPATDADADDDADATDATDATDAIDATAGATPRTEHRFFAWLRSLGLSRGEGWMGGVCAGVAARTGLDPILVRGIAVVIAVLGGPVVLLYALAWLLMPGADGVIHAQDLGRGRPTRALAGIAGLLLLSLLPLTQGFWYVGAQYWGEPDVLASLGRILWTAVVVVLAVIVIVWVSRRTHGGAAPASGTPTAPSAAPAFGGQTTSTTGADDPAAPDPAAFIDDAPPSAPVGATPEQLAEWQQGQAAWQQQRAQWVAAENERRLLRVKEVAEAAAERRRIRQSTRPRANAAVVGLIVGVALLVGGFAALAASTSILSQGHEWGIGIAAATIAIGLGIVVVGLARRRSGFLAFLGIVGLLATAAGAAVPQDRQVLPPTGYGISSFESGAYAQVGGETSIYANGDGPATAPVIDVWKLGGSVNINLDPGATVQLELISAPRHGYVQVQDRQGSFILGGTLTETATNAKGESVQRALIGPGSTPTLIVRVWLGADGYLSVYGYVDDQEAADAFAITPALTDPYVADDTAVPSPDPDQGLVPTPTPTPTSTPTPDATGAP